MTHTRTAYYKAGADTDRDPWGCRYKPKPYIIATFRNEQLVEVTRMHNRVDRNGRLQGRGIAPEPLDVAEWGGRA